MFNKEKVKFAVHSLVVANEGGYRIEAFVETSKLDLDPLQKRKQKKINLNSLESGDTNPFARTLLQV